jgi:K+-sensing histidine kinase KdpD
MSSATFTRIKSNAASTSRKIPAKRRFDHALAVAGQYGVTTLMVGLCTLTAVVSSPILCRDNDMMLYFFAAYLAANKYGLGPALWACAVSTICYDYFVAAPLFQINRFPGDHLITLIIMFILIVVASERSARIKLYACRLEERVWERTRELAETNRELTMEIAKRKDTETALTKSLDEIASSNAALQQFARIASHDMQEPLKVIQGYTGLMRSRYGGKLDQKADEFLGYIFDSAMRMEYLIKGVLEHASVGSRIKPFQNVDMNECFADAYANLDQSITEKNAVVTSDSLPVIVADNLQMTRLLQNLIGNALKFVTADTRPRIHVSATRQDVGWVFRITDNGIGIENQYIEKIFGMFRRLHSTDEYPGTGLGLAICKAIVDHHKGAIRVESIPGQGSTFSFTIPASRLATGIPEVHHE